MTSPCDRTGRTGTTTVRAYREAREVVSRCPYPNHVVVGTGTGTDLAVPVPVPERPSRPEHGELCFCWACLDAGCMR